MRVLVDISHPAHVHFFRNPIRILKELGNEVVVTSRDKDVAISLLAELGVKHRQLDARRGTGIVSLGRELLARNIALVKAIQDAKPDVLTAIGGTFIAHAGLVTGTPRIIFYDTENAVLQNLITYPFASLVAVPRAYQGWVPKGRSLRYAGYHELSYLHPQYFTPNRDIAVANGLCPDRDTFLLRVVGWQANHDIGEQGWSDDILKRIVEKLGDLGQVLISSERALPSFFQPYLYGGSVAAIHHVMHYCRIVVGESATMASEAAVLGVPAIYAATTGRGYTDEQEQRYGLVRNVRELSWTEIESAIDEVLGQPRAGIQAKRESLLSDTVDVAKLVTDLLCEPIAKSEPGSQRVPN